MLTCKLKIMKASLKFFKSILFPKLGVVVDFQISVFCFCDLISNSNRSLHVLLGHENLNFSLCNLRFAYLFLVA
jgi:hypothetical protein